MMIQKKVMKNKVQTHGHILWPELSDKYFTLFCKKLN